MAVILALPSSNSCRIQGQVLALHPSGNLQMAWGTCSSLKSRPAGLLGSVSPSSAAREANFLLGPLLEALTSVVCGLVSSSLLAHLLQLVSVHSIEVEKVNVIEDVDPKGSVRRVARLLAIHVKVEGSSRRLWASPCARQPVAGKLR